LFLRRKREMSDRVVSDADRASRPMTGFGRFFATYS
jgi:hypothetical protein